MEKKYGIRRIAGIRNGCLSENDRIILQGNNSSFDDFADEAYRTLGIAYPKFHKMDALSKLGFITSEALLHDIRLHEKAGADKIGLVLSNKSSSLDTDMKYYSMLEKGIASPAVFVYTLPNILIGEICIRNKIKGESVFFISDYYNINQQVEYIRMLLQTGVVEVCIGGWVELFGNSYDSFLYLVTKEDADCLGEFSEQTLSKMYHTSRPILQESVKPAT